MKLLKKEWFHAKRCMDIGCHTGDLTLQITFTFEPEIMIGVDIDHKVIAGAIKQILLDMVLILHISIDS